MESKMQCYKLICDLFLLHDLLEQIHDSYLGVSQVTQEALRFHERKHKGWDTTDLSTQSHLVCIEERMSKECDT